MTMASCEWTAKKFWTVWPNSISSSHSSERTRFPFPPHSDTLSLYRNRREVKQANCGD